MKHLAGKAVVNSNLDWFDPPLQVSPKSYINSLQRIGSKFVMQEIVENHVCKVMEQS